MKLKFGIQIEPQFGFSYETIREIALDAEQLGYTSIWSSDHFFLDKNSEKLNCLEAWTLIAALAAETSNIRLGTLVTSNSYRYPAVLAKMAATVDMISNGRLDFGIGAGWKEIEYDSYGIPFPSIKERMDRLEEAIILIKKLWTEPKVNFDGVYYQLKDAFSAPKPIQKLPPIFIGGSGKKRTMRLVAEHGDYLNLPFSPIKELKGILNAAENHCNDIGRNFDEIGKSYFTSIFVADTQEELDNRIEEIANRSGTPVEEIKNHLTSEYPGSWIGFPEQIKERISYMYDEFGFDYFHLVFPYPRDLEMTRRFASKIMDRF